MLLLPSSESTTDNMIQANCHFRSIWNLSARIWWTWTLSGYLVLIFTAKRSWFIYDAAEQPSWIEMPACETLNYKIIYEQFFFISSFHYHYHLHIAEVKCIKTHVVISNLFYSSNKKKKSFFNFKTHFLLPIRHQSVLCSFGL